LIGIICGVCGTIGVAFLFYRPENARWIVLITLAVMSTSGLAVALTSCARFRFLSAGATYVLIGNKCLLVGDERHSWSEAGAWLQSATLRTLDGELWLEVQYAFLALDGIQEEQVRIPVPREAEGMARGAAEELMRCKAL